MNALTWLAPTLMATLLYGVGQGLVKRNIGDVPPGRFCLYLVAAKSVVNLGFFFTQDHPPPFSSEGMTVMWIGLLAYSLEGAAWVLYFESIVCGPITIVGTLSAAYPALTVLFARIFLHEQLSFLQYGGLGMVILACVGLSYAPFTPDSKVVGKKWIPLATGALVLWGAAQTLVKWAYGFDGANEANLALYAVFGGAMTLGLYGLWTTRGMKQSRKEWGSAAVPMGMMAGGDLAVIVASRLGPISVVTPLSGAYPVVTLAFAAAVLKERITPLQWACIVLILAGMYLSLG
jgi:transporter family protein